MKKIIVLLVAILCLSGCAKTDSLDIKAETADMKVYNIDTDNYLDISLADSLKLLTKGTGVIYYGFATCPWCVDIVPILDEVAKSNNQKVYYVDVRKGGADLRVDDNKDYMAVVDYLKGYLKLDDNKKPRLYVPHIFFVKDGKVVGEHANTIGDHNAKERELTTEERAQIVTILNDLFAKIK